MAHFIKRFSFPAVFTVGLFYAFSQADTDSLNSQDRLAKVKNNAKMIGIILLCNIRVDIFLLNKLITS